MIHTFFADAYHIRVNMWTHTVYIYIYTHTYSLYCTYLHLYMPNTVMFVHLSTSLQSPNKRCLPWPSSHGAGPPSFRFGRRLPPTRPHGWDWGLPYQAVPEGCKQKWGIVRWWRPEYNFLNSEEYFINQWFFKFSMAPSQKKKPRLSNIAKKKRAQK